MPGRNFFAEYIANGGDYTGPIKVRYTNVADEEESVVVECPDDFDLPDPGPGQGDSLDPPP